MNYSCAEKIGLHIYPMNSKIAGVGGNTSTQVLGCTCAHIRQKYGFPDLLIPFFVVTKVTLDLPSMNLPRSRWTHLENLDLADPNFHCPRPVDIIFSADVLNSVCLNETKPSLRGSPFAFLTSFGWIISGGYLTSNSKSVQFNAKVSVRSTEDESVSEIQLAHAPSTTDQYTKLSKPQPQRLNWQGVRPSTRNSSPPNAAPFTRFRTSVGSAPSTLTLAPISQKVIGQISHQPPQYAELLNKMFRIESVDDHGTLSPDESLAEEIFRKSVCRLPDGRFQVDLPFKCEPTRLGHSRSIALKKFKTLENRLRKFPEQRQAYNDFMHDYLRSNHMELASPLQVGQPCYFLPHHAVHRSGDPPNKIRVVFNASQATMSKCSLNDVLLPGPKLQLDITEVITRFRLDRWVFVADVRQMFRQILHPPKDRDFLRILWRFSEEEQLKEYRLCTVTYGTASAPYLAGRVMREIAALHENTHPNASAILKTRTYVDDLNGGSDDLRSAIDIRKELQEVLSLAKLELRKWAANDFRLLDGIPTEHLLPRMTSVSMEDPEDSSLKVLGLSWEPHSDTFHYALNPIEQIRTKRQLASQIARVYDPLGWLMPITVFARVIFRTVVQNHHDWDDVLPPSIVSDWSRLAQELPCLAKLHIPRYIPVAFKVQWLVGFADASERAYGAVLYLVSSTNGRTYVSLITAKARMAPIKAVTLPRLELCAAYLLAKTIKKSLPALRNVLPDHIIALSDSEISLSWITAEQPPLWKVFVGNRVASIHENVPSHHWFHVPSKQNPADHASRGLRPQELMDCEQWWNGPKWMQLPLEEWPIRRIRPELKNPTVISEARTSFVTAATISPLAQGTRLLEERFSSLTLLETVVGLCLRYIQLLRIRRTAQQRDRLKTQYLTLKMFVDLPRSGHLKRRGEKPTDAPRDTFEPLSADERASALGVLVRRAQAQSLSQELADSQLRRPRLRITRSLGLFIDSSGVLRVGGRLRNSQLPDHEKHPALLPSLHSLTNMLIERCHKSLLHAGPLSTLHHLRATGFWIVNGKNVVRRRLAQCVDCFTVRPRPFQPEMGQLPADRTITEYPFSITGVDYAGPFPVSIAGLRGNRILQCYLAVFICFSTKAVHLEVVTDLSTPGFLQAFNRFVSRRGCPHTMWSDNGRNFLGAANDLKRIQELLHDPDHHRAIAQETAARGITWKFIPPRAPFFGGLWEAAVKQAKRLLKTSLRNQVPTLESFTTIITQVEAVLNSRPLTAMSSSPDDLKVLTPAHFLIFRPLTAPPCLPNLDDRITMKERFRFTQHVVHTFWNRWKKEFLLEIQSRSKWETTDRPARIGDLVLVVDDNTPPLQWTMGKIIDIYPGKDGVTRVADVRTPAGSLSRPVRKLCPFPEEVCGAGDSTAGEDVPSSNTTPN